MHRILELAFVIFIALLLPYIVSLRPNSNGTMTKRSWILLMILGVIVAVIFITTQSLYEIQTTV